MKFYFAPMEGITGYLFRRAHHELFPSVDKYFTPFLVPHTSKVFNSREKNDILPEHNRGLFLVPQILTNQAKDFVRVAKELREYGYEEVNLNLGCPSKTVVTKKKGSGFLAFPEDIDRFLDEVFQTLDMKISVKTRIGKEDPKEFETLLNIYNQYPLEELMIHPRLQTDYYKNKPDWNVFGESLSNSKNPVCYNGDLFSKEDYVNFVEQFPTCHKVMFGRGLLKNPGLVETIRDENCLTKEKLKRFHDRLVDDYEALKIGDRNVLFKMKELWFYMIELFEDHKKLEKKIKKAQSLSAYREAVDRLFYERDMIV